MTRLHLRCRADSEPARLITHALRRDALVTSTGCLKKVWMQGGCWAQVRVRQ